MAKKNIQIPEMSKFNEINPNARNNSTQTRDKSKDMVYVIGVAGGNAGAVRVDHPEAPSMYQTDDPQMSAIELLATLLEKRANAEDSAPTTIYVPCDSMIRAKSCFGAAKNGTEPVSEKALAYISKFRSEEYTARYMAAVDKMMDAIKVAREAKKLIIVRELDEFQFSVVNGVLGLDDNQTFLLSGLEVNFEASKENSDYGVARIAKGTVIGKSNPITLTHDVWIRAERTYGAHKLSVHNVHGDKRNRKLVALINEEQHPEYKVARSAYFALLNVMSPADAEAEKKDLGIGDFKDISTESEIPA